MARRVSLSNLLCRGSELGELGRLRLFLLNSVAANPVCSARTRIRLLRLGGVDIRGGAIVAPDAKFVGGHLVSIHDGVYVNTNVLFDGAARVDCAQRSELDHVSSS